MAVSKKSLENLKGNTFRDKPERINRRGRPRKLVSVVTDELKKQGYSAVAQSEIKEAYLTLLNLPMSKVKAIADPSKDNHPILYKLVAKELIGRRGQEMLERLLDRSIGRPDQNINIQQEQPLFPDKPKKKKTDEV